MVEIYDIASCISLPFSSKWWCGEIHINCQWCTYQLLIPSDTQIQWENRLIHDDGRRAKVTVDGTDFLCEPEYDGEPRKSWISFKFRKPAVRYDVAISILNGDIVWLNGPYKAGSFADLSIFRRGLKQQLLEDGERAVADDGYRGEAETIDLPLDGRISAGRLIW